jgi:geranylgeranyl pyrophosphate synthase
MKRWCNGPPTLALCLRRGKFSRGALIATGAKVGAYLAGAPIALVEEAERYGLNMGIAFQMVDDVLDVVGHVDLLGKPVGMDLRDGNPALPIILAVNSQEPAVRAAFENSKPSEEQIDCALTAIKTGSAIQEAKSLSKRYAREALKSVKKLPPSMYRNGLKTLVELIIDRDF